MFRVSGLYGVDFNRCRNHSTSATVGARPCVAGIARALTTAGGEEPESMPLSSENTHFFSVEIHTQRTASHNDSDARLVPASTTTLPSFGALSWYQKIK